jgi:hypothetical protein
MLRAVRRADSGNTECRLLGPRVIEADRLAEELWKDALPRAPASSERCGHTGRVCATRLYATRWSRASGYALAVDSFSATPPSIRWSGTAAPVGGALRSAGRLSLS